MKRFTDCNKWDDPWFMALSSDLKLFYLWMTDKADNAGVWKVNPMMAAFIMKQPTIEMDKVFEDINRDDIGKGRPRVVEIAADKWWITRFLMFHYGTDGVLKFSQDCRPHQSVIALIKAHGLEDLVEKHYPGCMDFRSGPNPAGSKPHPTIEQIILLDNAKGMPEDAVKLFWNHWQAEGWKRNRKRVEDINALLGEWNERGRQLELDAPTPKTSGDRIKAIQNRIEEIRTQSEYWNVAVDGKKTLKPDAKKEINALIEERKKLQ